MANAVINTDLKKYTKKYVVEDNILWEVLNDNISKAEMIWDMENIADLFNKLVEENEQLKKDCTALIYHNQEYRKENEQLKKEKESWKSNACSLSSLNSILSNELSIAQEQGYEPSKPYKEYIASIKTEYSNF